MDRYQLQRDPAAATSTSTSSSTSNRNSNSVSNAAQNLINALTQDITQSNALTQNITQSPFDGEMERSFNFLPKKSGSAFLGKRKMQTPKACGTASPKPWKPFSFYLYLLNQHAKTTPSAEEEVKLAQAGLGKRLIKISKDMGHEEFSRLLQVEYPKMQEVTGGYYLYKAPGGQGKRRLLSISPDFTDGYSATLIRSVTGGGKKTLFAVPLQHEFDLTPLPPDAMEFLHTPKEQCKICKITYPLQILPLHVQKCVAAHSSEDDYDDDEETCQSEVEIVSVSAPPLHHDQKTSVEEKVPCPICFMEFTPQFLELHASRCGERKEQDLGDAEDAMRKDKHDAETSGMASGDEQIKSVDDVLDTITRRVDRDKQFKIQISRTSILQRGLLQWERQKKTSPSAHLYVTFFGEAGVDTGALRKEFLTEMVAGIEGRFFEGPQNQRVPRYSLTDFDRGLFRTVGEILAVSFAQGGPSPAFFSPWTYSYLCSGQINTMNLNSSVVADEQLRALIEQVESSTEQSIKAEALSDEIYNRGYTGKVSFENKESIVRAIVLHAMLRLQPMLEQLTEGLKLYDLLSLIRKYPDICQPLFVPGEDVKVNAEFFIASIRPLLSSKGTNKHQVEIEMMNFLQDFLYEAEAEDQGHGLIAEDRRHVDDTDGPITPAPSPITPARLLQWITGQGHVPLLPSEKKDFGVVIKFNHDCTVAFGDHTVCYPVVSACTKTIELPVRHMSSYDQLKTILTEALHQGQEFSNV